MPVLTKPEINLLLRNHPNLTAFKVQEGNKVAISLLNKHLVRHIVTSNGYSYYDSTYEGELIKQDYLIGYDYIGSIWRLSQSLIEIIDLVYQAFQENDIVLREKQFDEICQKEFGEIEGDSVMELFIELRSRRDSLQWQIDSLDIGFCDDELGPDIGPDIRYEFEFIFMLVQDIIRALYDYRLEKTSLYHKTFPRMLRSVDMAEIRSFAELALAESVRITNARFGSDAANNSVWVFIKRS